VCYKGWKFNNTVIRVHATEEKKDDISKGSFYDKLHIVYRRAPEHDTRNYSGSPKNKDW
jgi:hypothetical protein